MAGALLARMQAVGPCLEAAANASPEEWAAVSTSQSGALLAMIQERPPSGIELVQATEWVCRAKWHRQEDADFLRAGLAQASQARPGRWRPQNYECLSAFMTQPLWAQLLNPELDITGKLRSILWHLASLGMRQPSEPTFATIVAFALVCHEGQEKARAADPSALHDVYMVTKQTWKKLKVGPAQEHVDVLPLLPSQLQSSHPRLYEAAFATEGPCASQVSSVIVSSVAAAVPMRKREASRATLAAARSAQPLQQPMQDMCSMMQNMARMFMQSQQPSGLPGFTVLQPPLGSGSAQAQQSGPAQRIGLPFGSQLQLAPAPLAAGLSQPSQPQAAQPLVAEAGQQPSPSQPLDEGPQAQAKTKKLSVDEMMQITKAAMDESKKHKKKESGGDACGDGGEAEEKGRVGGGAKGKAKGKAKAKAKAKAHASSTAALGDKFQKKRIRSGTIEVERTRASVLCRLDKGGKNSTKSISYDGPSGKDLKTAFAEGVAWLKKHA